MLPLLMDDLMDAADRPVQKEPAAIAHRRRSRGLLQQHTEQYNFDLHSPQKQTEIGRHRKGRSVGHPVSL